jgi:hypothetical protein
VRRALARIGGMIRRLEVAVFVRLTWPRYARSIIEDMTRAALVLSGAGLVGVRWELGVMRGLISRTGEIRTQPERRTDRRFTVNVGP